MLEKEIVDIKKNGKLIAIQDGEYGGFQYWRYNGMLYSISASGNSMNIWCSENGLSKHLHRLYQVIGHKFFTEGPNMVVIDKDFVRSVAYA